MPTSGQLGMATAALGRLLAAGQAPILSLLALHEVAGVRCCILSYGGKVWSMQALREAAEEAGVRVVTRARACLKQGARTASSTENEWHVQ